MGHFIVGVVGAAFVLGGFLVVVVMIVQDINKAFKSK
jgi:hypothetical protein